ncbi:MAG: HVA1 family protein [Oceanicaulis sp.]
MTKAYSTGETVKWNWGNGEGGGEVAEVHTDRVEEQIKGETIARNGSEDNPAYLIEAEDGTRVLKLHSELHKD